MYAKQPYSLEAFLPQDINVFLFRYTASEDEATDLANMKTELEKRLLLLDSTWDDDNGGIYESTDTTGVATVAQGDDGVTSHPTAGGYSEALTDVVIEMAQEWEDTVPTEGNRHLTPVVLYNNVPVPLSDINHMGDGKSAGDLCIIVDNTGLKYGAASPTESEWRVCLCGQLIGVRSEELGGLSLPITTTDHHALGVENTVISRTVQDGAEGSGNIVVFERKERLYVASGIGATAEVLNHPGEDLEKALFGSDWTSGAENEVDYIPSGTNLGVAVLALNSEMTGGSYLPLHGTAGNTGKVFGKLTLLLDCKLTDFQNPGNTSGGTDDTVQRQIALTWKRVIPHVFRTQTA